MKAAHFAIAVTLLVRKVLVGADATCNLCGSHPIPNNGLLQQKNGISCRKLFDDLTFLEEGTVECGHIQLAAFQTGCCNEQFVPENACSVCPDGSSSYDMATTIPGSATRRELTCADLPTEAYFFDFLTRPGQCDDTFLQRSAAWCGCPGHEVKCHLCPNGETPEDLDRTEKVLYGWDCRSFQYITALLAEGECSVASEILDFDAAAFCCQGIDAPDLCPMCPTGQILSNPDREVRTEYGTMKCGEIEDSLRMIPSLKGCAVARQSVNSGQCCEFSGARSSVGGDYDFTAPWILLTLVVISVLQTLI